MEVEVSTSEYEFAHGKQPRGYGQWGFFFDQEQDVMKAFWHTGKFADAKRTAVAYAVTKGHRTVRVAS